MTSKSVQMNQKVEQLLPCCFCGRANPSVAVDGYELYFVVCPRCNAHGPTSTLEKKAIALWNKRHDVEIFNEMFGGGT